MEEFIGAASVAALSGLAYMAYKHPKAYRRIYLGIVLIYAALFAAGKMFNAGMKSAHDLVQAAGYKDAAALLMKRLTPDTSGPEQLIVFAVIAFLGFLLWLPDLIALDRKGKE